MYGYFITFHLETFGKFSKMAKTKRRDNKVRNRRTKSRRGGGPKKLDPYWDAYKIPYNAPPNERGFVFDKNYRPSTTFSLIPPLSSLFSSSGVRKPKKNMYEQFVYRRENEIKKIKDKAILTPDDENKIKQLQHEIAEYKMKNENMLREGATRSKYPLAQRTRELWYDTKRAVLGPEGRYSPDSSDSD